jgi:hypothetical protein
MRISGSVKRSQISALQQRLAGREIRAEQSVRNAMFNNANKLVRAARKRIYRFKGITYREYMAAHPRCHRKESTSSPLVQTMVVEPTDDGVIVATGNTGHDVYPEFGTGRKGTGKTRNDEEKGQLPEGASYDSGWSGMPATPYLHPSAEEIRQQLPEELAASFREGYRR